MTEKLAKGINLQIRKAEESPDRVNPCQTHAKTHNNQTPEH